jgi:hypothetical protein
LPDFSKQEHLERWLRSQPWQVGIALAARSALRVLPIIGLPLARDGTGALTLADEKILQTQFRALSIAWIGFGAYAGDRRLRIVARAGLAAATILPIGFLSTNSAASAARRSVAQAVHALTTAGQKNSDALVAAIGDAFSAESACSERRGASALTGDVEFLAGGAPSSLVNVPLWPNHPPTWAEQWWRNLKLALTNAQNDWQVWTAWYDDRLDGRVRSTEREVAYVDVPDDLWGQGPAVVNAAINSRIKEHEPSTQPILPPEMPARDQSTIVSENKSVIDFSRREEVEHWLEGKSREVAVVFAVRAALRVTPLLAILLGARGGDVPRVARDIILPVFRAIATRWAAGQYPNNHGPELRAAVAADATTAAFVAAGATAQAILGAVRAAVDVAVAYNYAYAAAHAVAADAHAVVGVSNTAATAGVAAAAVVAAAAATALAAEAELIDQGLSVAALASFPLWPKEVPPWARDAWGRLEKALLEDNDDWKVWIEWYRARLEGRPLVEALEVARVMIPDEVWERGPRAVNAEIARLIGEHAVREGRPQFKDEDDVVRWLEGKPREVAVAISVRAALRVAPLLITAIPLPGGDVEAAIAEIILPEFRAMAESWGAVVGHVEFRDSDPHLASYLDVARAASGGGMAARDAAMAIFNVYVAAFGGDNNIIAASASRCVTSAAGAAASDEAVGYAGAGRTPRANQEAIKTQAAELVFAAISADAEFIDTGSPPATLAARPLWPKGVPNWAWNTWVTLERTLISDNADWKVWTEWYRDRFEGRSFIPTLEAARVQIPEDIWQQGARAVNAEIARLISEDRNTEREIFEYGTAPNWDFFLSYSKEDEAFARWIKELLNEAGFSVFAQFADMPPGSNFVREMQRGLSESSRLVALLSPGYVKSDHCQAEWATAYNDDPGGKDRKLIPLLIRPTTFAPSRATDRVPGAGRSVGE